MAVIERVGARLEGRYVRAHHYAELGWVDRLAYAVLAEEWDVAARQRRDL